MSLWWNSHKTQSSVTRYECLENTDIPFSSGGQWGLGSYKSTITWADLPVKSVAALGCSTVWGAVPLQGMMANTTNMETLHPTCKMPVWLRKAQTPRKRQVLTSDFAPWSLQIKRSQSSQVTPSCPACGLAAVREVEIAYIVPQWRMLSVCLSLWHIQVYKALQDLKQDSKISKIWSKTDKMLLVYSPGHAKAGENR